MTASRYVLLGSIGFVGSNLLQRLSVPLVAPSLEEADLTDLDSLRRTFRAGDIIINAAGYANATDQTEKGRQLCQAINVDGVRKLAQAAAEAGAAHLVHISSVAAMGRWYQEGVTEEMLTPPTTIYAQSKLDGEQILADFHTRLPLTIIRPTSVFGEGRGLAHTLCKVVARGLVPLPGGGAARIPFTYIGNIAHAIESCLGQPACFGRTFIVGDADSYPLRTVVLALAGAMGQQVTIVPVPVGLATLGVRLLERRAAARGVAPLLDQGRLETLTRSLSYSIAAFQTATGYQPPFTLAQAAERIVTWFRTLPE
jgi:nucleoside-diphosphate-sugar epimerase